MPSNFVRNCSQASSAKGDFFLGGPLPQIYKSANLSILPRERESMDIYDKDKDPDFEIVRGRFAGGAAAFALDVRMTFRAYIENCRVPRYTDKKTPSFEQKQEICWRSLSICFIEWSQMYFLFPRA